MANAVSWRAVFPRDTGSFESIMRRLEYAQSIGTAASGRLLSALTYGHDSLLRGETRYPDSIRIPAQYKLAGRYFAWFFRMGMISSARC